MLLRRALIALLPLTLAACEDDAPDPRAPIIEAARPARAQPGQAVTLLGRNFGVGGAHDRVWLGGAPVSVESWTDHTLLVRLPAERPRGWFDFVIRAGERVGPPFPFEVRALADTDAESDSVRQSPP